MTSTAVVRPLNGAGVVARVGDLLLVCADGAGGVDDLLSLANEVSAGGGNGNVLVRRLAALLAVDELGRYPSCAASGPASDGATAVLVYGEATATVVNGDGAVSLSATESITSVTRLVAGPVSSIRLQLPGAGVADPRTRLDSGVISAAGVVVDYGQPTSLPSWPTSGYSYEAAPSAPAESFGPAAFVPQSLVPASFAAESFGSAPSVPQSSVPDSFAPEPFVPEQLAPESFAPEPFVPEVGGSSPVSAPPVADAQQPWVVGVRCPNDHFTDPNLGYCLMCGVALVGQALAAQEGPRPALGKLVLDDGSSVRLDLGCVIGREPQHDPEVIAGSARGLKMVDAEGVVSRRHLRVSLVGWEVHIVDLGSANGTFVQGAGEEQRHQLVAGQPVIIRPGSQVTMGRRWLRYDLDPA